MTGEIRRTRQRTHIWDYLGGTAEFLTAQQVHDRLRAGGTPVSLPTVYRTLAAMAEAGEVDQLVGEDGTAYRRCSPHHHHHLICRVCGRTIELTADPVEAWAAEVARAHGFTGITHVTEISGTCPACSASTGL
ncbi:MAG: transcriptional repressor [Propionibacteriaceae bacterium]|jgi:Fur family ferric uptake transcriptional regulator|nr:transcriptional repressor [Propionibacteriaceae bacterium]